MSGFENLSTKKASIIYGKNSNTIENKVNYEANCEINVSLDNDNELEKATKLNNVNETVALMVTLPNPNNTEADNNGYFFFF